MAISDTNKEHLKYRALMVWPKFSQQLSRSCTTTKCTQYYHYTGCGTFFTLETTYSNDNAQNSKHATHASRKSRRKVFRWRLELGRERFLSLRLPGSEFQMDRPVQANAHPPWTMIGQEQVPVVRNIRDGFVECGQVSGAMLFTHVNT